MAQEPYGAPIPMTKPPAAPKSQWPTDAGEMLGYYRTILKQIAGIETDLKALTGDPKLQWSGGQLKAMSRLQPAARERVMQAQSQIAALREEKTEIERMIPGIMKMRESQLSGMSPTQARATERKGLEGLGGAMRAASAPQQAESPMGRQMLEAEFGAVDDPTWNAYRQQRMGLPSSTVNPLDERAMALREQESRVQRQQYAQAFQSQQQQYAQETQMQREAQQRQMEQYQQALRQQAFENQMAQQQFGASVAGDMAGMRQQAWAQGMPWAVPGGTQYTPNFDPGGMAQQVASGIGFSFTPQPVARWDAPDPQAYYRQMSVLGNVPLPQQYQQPQPQPQQQQPTHQMQPWLPYFMNVRGR